MIRFLLGGKVYEIDNPSDALYICKLLDNAKTNYAVQRWNHDCRAWTMVDAFTDHFREAWYGNYHYGDLSYTGRN